MRQKLAIMDSERHWSHSTEAFPGNTEHSELFLRCHDTQPGLWCTVYCVLWCTVVMLVTVNFWEVLMMAAFLLLIIGQSARRSRNNFLSDLLHFSLASVAAW